MIYIIFNKTPLILATEKNNAEIVELLLTNKSIDVNKKSFELNNDYDYYRSFSHEKETKKIFIKISNKILYIFIIKQH